MTSPHRPAVVLCGPPGAGKTTVGSVLARALGVEALDSDHEVERVAGTTVPDLFRERGEEAFRALEHETVTRLLTSTDGVLALGGGAVMDPRTRAALRGHAVVFLDVATHEAVSRVAASGERPLLQGDPAATFDALMERRRDVYAAASTVRIDTSGRPPQDVAEEVLAHLRARDAATTTDAAPRAVTPPAGTPSTVTVSGADGYDVTVGRGLVRDVVSLVGEGATRVLVVHAPAVAEPARRIAEAVEATGRAAHLHALPDAEAAKDVATLSALWDLAGTLHLGRQDAVVAVGGGATTDVAGFLAASWLRGIRLVNVPTTLLAMVDAAVGGKTGINTPAGKNLVGAFHPPAGVVCDLDLLTTLPEADLRAGLGEVIKCGFIADEKILRIVEADGGAAALDPSSEVTRELVERALAVKARVVGEDLTEQGLREILNYGHTFGHAIEAVEDFRVRHGEAVAIGMVFAGELAVRAGVLDPSVVARMRRILRSVGLPPTYDGAPWEALLDAMRHDKKVRQGVLRFVVLEDVARTSILRDPDPEHLRAAYDSVAGGAR